MLLPSNRRGTVWLRESAWNFAAMSVHLSVPEQYSALLKKYDTWMFDCDGVLWNGSSLIPGAVQVLAMLRAKSVSGAFNKSYLT
jgi:hypothetical protein